MMTMATEKRLIDANALLDDVEVSLHDNPHTDSIVRATHKHEHSHFMVMIMQAPTVDAVEVVRCKDCIYCSTKRGSRYKQLLRFCEWGDGHERVQSDGKFFCAHGERSKYAVD